MDNLLVMIVWALAGVVVSVVAELAGIKWLVFAASVLGIIPLAALIGEATEDLAVRIGPRIGGFLNATLANLPELIVSAFLVLGGEVEVVKLAITGAIIGNLLLVLGAALFFGGLRYQEQTFNAKVAGMHAASLALAEVGLIMPAIFHAAAPHATFRARETVSLGVAGILILLYLSSLLFSFRTHREILGIVASEARAKWSKGRATLLLAASAGATALLSDFLVGSLKPAVDALGLSKPFVGLVLVPLVGNAAEHAGAVRLAVRDQMDVSIEIAVGSSTQIALFVAPFLVFFSLAVGKPINFFFSGFEVAAVGLSTAIVALISLDGRSDWLEGAQLIAAYAIIALSYYFVAA
ncbi:MAG TPA: calcium/proton exchanger [Actinomycetota bacterium]|nr:calcium/proton exchanger [Actinomycetota bacterium]